MIQAYEPASSPILADIHMHTNYSHGLVGVDAMYYAAKAKGLSVIGFSEHSPRPKKYLYAQDYQEHLCKNFPRYIDEVLALKQRAAAEHIEVLLGVEIDYIPDEEEYSKSLCTAYPYDYIIGGLHFQGTWGFDASPEIWDSFSQSKKFAIYEQYYADLEKMCSSSLFHVVAHPDLIKIFSVQDFHTWLESSFAKKRVQKTLEAMREYGLVMEVSSAGLRKACNEIYPCPAIMEMAAKAGLRISFAGDAHCASTVAYAFKSLAQYAHSFGYKESYVFVQGTAKKLAFTAE